MRRTLPSALSVAVMVLVGSLAVTAAQAPDPVEGQLVRVEPENMTLTIVTPDGAERPFRYTDATEVIGAQGGAAGLATVAGATVLVHYEKSAEPERQDTAIKIEVQS